MDDSLATLLALRDAPGSRDVLQSLGMGMGAETKGAVVYGMVEQGAAVGDVHVGANQGATGSKGAGGGILSGGRHCGSGRRRRQ
jgi:hypothetical protein